MTIHGTTAAEADRLRTSAASAQYQAASARALAAEIGHRRSLVIGRADETQARHRPEVWMSIAATQSRTELQQVIGFSLWLVGEGLSETRVALEQRAATLEASARSLHRQADAADATTQATRIRSVSSTTSAFG